MPGQDETHVYREILLGPLTLSLNIAKSKNSFSLRFFKNLGLRHYTQDENQNPKFRCKLCLYALNWSKIGSKTTLHDIYHENLIV